MHQDNYDHLINNLKDTLDTMSTTIKYYRQRIDYLESELVKDEEIKKLIEERDYWQTRAINGFEISEEEKSQIQDWKKKHDAEAHGLTTLDKRIEAGGAIGGRYSYHFIPTSIGVIGKCRCDKCGAEFEFQSL